MIYVYWPGRPVPEWLEDIKFNSRQNNSNPYVAHGGFGLVARSRGAFHVLGVVGSFICIRNCNDISIVGQGNGVIYHETLSSWVKSLFVKEAA